jgi:integrase
VSAALPGVAVAVALVPQLSTVGFTLAIGREDLAGGAVMLFVANLVAIELVSSVVLAGASPAQVTPIRGTRSAPSSARTSPSRSASPSSRRSRSPRRRHPRRQPRPVSPSAKRPRLAFASAVGTPLDDHNVRRQFRVITEDAGPGKSWVPRELRHTFVSLLSAHGVPVEAIGLLAGHNQTATTELAYRHQIAPALPRGAEVMDRIFS